MGLIMTWIVFLLPNLWITIFVNPFTFPKWIFLDLMMAMAAVSLARRKEISWPSNDILFLGIALAIFRFIAAILNWGDVVIDSGTMAIGFIFLTLYFMQACTDCLMKQAINPYIIGGAILVLQCFTITSPVGNVNILSEYVILILPLGLLLINYTDQKWKRIALRAVVTGLITVLIFAQSRSAWIGLAIVAIYHLRNHKKILFSFVLVFGAAFFALSHFLKTGSTGHRFDVYITSLKMMQNNLFGIGGGNYEFGFIPFQMGNAEYPREIEIYQTPHNEILKWGIEQGVLYVAFVAGFFLVLGEKIIKFPSSKIKDFMVCTYLVLIPQILFQFPFENPCTILILAFLFSIVLKVSPETKIKTDRFNKAILWIIAILLCSSFVQRNVSRTLESTMKNNVKAMQLACLLDGSNWRVCFRAALGTIETQEDALPWIQKNIRNRPFDFHSLRALTFYYAAQGDKDRACQVAHVYNIILRESTIFENFMKEHCKDTKSPIEYKDPTQFARDYKAWLGL